MHSSISLPLISPVFKEFFEALCLGMGRVLFSTDFLCCMIYIVLLA